MNVDSLSSGIGLQNSLNGINFSGRPPKPPAPEELIKKADTNQDGLLSNEEFGLPEDKFAEIDTDSDGFLTQEELQTDYDNMQAKMKENMGNLGALMNQGEAGSVSDFINSLLEKEDSDEDGSLSKKEFKGPEELFSKIDSDEDGLLSAEELTADMEKQIAEMKTKITENSAMQLYSSANSDENNSLFSAETTEQDLTLSMLNTLFGNDSDSTKNSNNSLNIIA